MRRKVLIAFAVLFIVAALAGLFAFNWLQGQLKPMPPGPPFYVRYAKGESFQAVLRDLQTRGVVRNPDAFSYWAKWAKKSRKIDTGTYQFNPGMAPDQVLEALGKPVRQMVRLPEGWWIARTAKILEEKGVCTSDEYIALTTEPAKFQSAVDFPLPKQSLEGYLFPDTYDLPPLLGAEETIRRQLRTFETKVVKPLGSPKNLDHLVTIGSLIEAEVAQDHERPIVAGLIENRTKKGMKLQIDATVLYALQEWKELGPGVVNTIDSPYNTYRIPGLPPGPIGSPGFKSIEAAAKPKANSYLYYVALPDRTHMFSADYAGHLANIRKRKAALKAVK